MFTYTLEEKISAVFDKNQAPDWNHHNIYNAIPVVLSGQKEGFYFANWIMQFKDPFVINQVSISPKDYLNCLETDEFECNTCRFFEFNTYPILLDKSNIQLTREGFDIYRKLVYYPRGETERIFDAAQDELLSHGRPLHYQVLSKMLANRYPNLGVTDQRLHKVLKLNPYFFHNLGNGVYQAIPGITKSVDSPLSVRYINDFDS